MQYGPFDFDAESRRLVHSGETIHLTPKAFDLLTLLIEHAPRVVTKRDLHDGLWPHQAVTDATLVGLVKELRRALGDGNAENRIIRTVHRIGYAFDLPPARPSAAKPANGLLLIGQRRIDLTEGECVVGRNAGCEVCIDDATVSRRHARIVLHGDRITLEDLGSKNGTRIGGRTVVGRCKLSDGDEIQFGEVDAVFREAVSNQPTTTQLGTG